MIGRLTVPVAVGACRRFGDAAKPQEAAAGAGATVPAAEGAGATVPAAAGAPAGDKTATPPKVQELVDRILELNVLEVNQLLFRLQTRLGISDAQIASSGGGGSAAGPAAGAPSAAAPAAAAAPPKETVDIKIGAVDAKAKIKVSCCGLSTDGNGSNATRHNRSRPFFSPSCPTDHQRGSGYNRSRPRRVQGFGRKGPSRDQGRLEEGGGRKAQEAPD